LLKKTIKIGNDEENLIDFLVRSETDLFLGWREGEIICEYAAPYADWDKPHIIFSISKSISGVLAGILEDQGKLDTSKTLDFYFSNEITGAFKDCTIRNLLDMRVSLDFAEEYLNHDGDYARYRRSTLWNPPLPGKQVETLKALLFKLPKGKVSHGGPFHYQSPNSDMLGILLEKVSGHRYTDLMSSVLWSPMGAGHNCQMTVDAEGTPRGAGGISMAAHDLLRVGQLLMNEGQMEGRQIISKRWISDMMDGGDHDAWEQGNFSSFLPGGRYRSQWYQMPKPMQALFAVGIHGQWLYVDKSSHSIFVKLSSQSIPQNDGLDEDCLAMFKQLSVAGA
jgi:CubicO group peptidase (beta-lactamase class C family)